MTYDALGRMTSEQGPWGTAVTFTYDGNDNRTKVVDSLGGTTTAVYDVLDRMTSEQFSGTGSQVPWRVDWTYSPRDQVATVTHYSDVAGTTVVGTASYVYDAAERLTKLTQYYANGTVLASYVYNYDSQSRLTSEVDNGKTTSYMSRSEL